MYLSLHASSFRVSYHPTCWPELPLIGEHSFLLCCFCRAWLMAIEQSVSVQVSLCVEFVHAGEICPCQCQHVYWQMCVSCWWWPPEYVPLELGTVVSNRAVNAVWFREVVNWNKPGFPSQRYRLWDMHICMCVCVRACACKCAGLLCALCVLGKFLWSISELVLIYSVTCVLCVHRPPLRMCRVI